MTLPTRIFLVGLPGAGKSTVGEYLAKELNYSFYDLDTRIEREVSKTIAEIFEENGEPYFRKIESEQLLQLGHEKIVVATGGGTPCFYDNMNWMCQNGLTIFLNPGLEIISHRISKQAHRPLIGEDKEKSLKELLKKRIPLYNQAGMESNLSEPREIMDELLIFVRN